MLEASGRRAVAVGNTEVPLVAAIEDPSIDVFVVEGLSTLLFAVLFLGGIQLITLGIIGEYISRIYDPRGERMYDERQQDEILGAQVGEGSLKTLPIPPEYDDEWRVEEDFVRYVRGEVPAMGPTFLDGVKNMEYLEAVYTSTAEGRWVDLPRH